MRAKDIYQPDILTNHNETDTPIKFQKKHLPAEELKQRLPDAPGAHATAMAGIQNDFEARDIPAPVLVKISFNPAKISSYPNLLTKYHGLEINDGIGENKNIVELRLQFDSDLNALNFIDEIKNQDPNANFGMSVNESGKMMTAKGKVYLTGNSFINSDQHHRFPNNNQITSNIGTTNKSFHRCSTNKPHSYQNLTAKVFEHASTIEPTESEMPHKNTVEITIRGAANRNLQEEEILELIQTITIAADQFSYVINQTANSLEIVIGEESAPGAVGQKMHQTLLNLARTYNIALDVNSFAIHEVNKRVTLSREKPKILPRESGTGIYTSHNFRKALQKTRNQTLATYTLDKNGKVIDIQPNYTEIPDETQPAILVARDEELEILRESIENPDHKPVRVITGVSGIGKTALMQKVMNEAKEKGIRVAYFKTPEQESNTPTFGIRLILKRLFELLPSDPKNKKSLLYEFATNPATKMSTNQVAIGLLKLLMDHSKKEPILMCLDDLHWDDSFTDEVVAIFISLLPQAEGKMITWLASRTGEEGISKKIKDRIAKYPLSETIELEEFKDTKDISDCIKGSLPKGYREATIPESFLQDFQRITNGIPLDIKELMEYLIENRMIQFDPKTAQINIPKETEDKLKNGQGTDILNAVYENKFKRLGGKNKKKIKGFNEVLDYLVIFGELGQTEFINLMEKSGHNRTEINKLLEELEEKKMITWEPFGFRHDRLQEIKKNQLEQRGKTAKLAAEGFSRLKDKNIAPETLFKLLIKATSNRTQYSQLSADLKSQIKSTIYPTGKQALDRAMENKNAILASYILEEILKLTEKTFNNIIDDQNDPEKATRHAITLANHYLTGINLSTKIGKLTSTNGESSANTYDTKLKQLLQKKPEINAGKIALRKLTLEMKTALASNDPDAYTRLSKEAETEINIVVNTHFSILQNYESFEEYSNIEKRELVDLFKALIEAKAELIIIKSKPPMNEDAKVGLKEFTALKELPCNTKETIKMINDHAFDIKRNIAVMSTYNLLKNTNPDFIYLEEYDEEKTREMEKLLKDLENLIKYVESASNLEIDADKVASLYNMAAKLTYILTKDTETADTYINSGIKLTTNHHAILSLVRLRKVRADAIKQLNILANFGDINEYFRFSDITMEEFDLEDLENAITDYDQSTAELNRINPQDGLITNNYLNRAILTAIRLFKMKGEEEGINEQELVKEWALYVTALEKFKNRSDTKDEDYFNELTTAGWFLQIAEQTNVKLKIPDFVSLENLNPVSNQLIEQWSAMRAQKEASKFRSGETKYDRAMEVKTIIQRFGLDKLRQGLIQKERSKTNRET